MKTNNNIPALRFQGFEDDWEEVKLGEVLEERNVQQLPQEDTPLVSFTVENGVTPKTDRYDREFLVRTGDKKYKYTELDDIVYNPANLKFGAISRNKFGKAVFSPIYVTLVVNKSKVFASFIEGIVTKRDFIQEALQYQEGTVYERMAVKVSDFLSMKISLPSLPEQEAIGTFFSTLDRHITLHQRKLDTLKEQKKTYLKLLFPAKGQTKPALRFQGFEDDWKEVKLGEIVVWEKGSGLSKSDLNIEDRGGKVIHYADLYRYKEVITEIFHSSESIEGKAIPLNSLLFPMSDVTPQGLARASSISIEGVRAGGDILIANIKDNSSIFLSYQVNANYRYILPLVTGTTVRHISSTSLSTIPISLPSLPEQEAIGTFFQTLDQEIAQVEDKLASLKEMKKTLLRKLFV